MSYITKIVNPRIKGDMVNISTHNKILIIALAFFFIYVGATIYYKYRDKPYSMQNALLFSFGFTWMILGGNIFSKGLIRIIFADQLFQDFKLISGII